MSAGKAVATSASPPTQRVVAVVEFLTVRDRPQSAAEIADGLGLSRSTVGAILSELDQKGWVIRRPDLTYRLGPALVAISERARPTLPHSVEVYAELDRLAERVGCAVGLSTVHRDQMIVVAVAGNGRIPAGIASGTRVPLAPPAGASIVAHADARIQEAWLARGPKEDSARLTRLLFAIRDTGVGIWGAGAANIDTVDVIADVVSFLSDSPASAALRTRVVQILSSLSGGPYTPDQLAVDDDLNISVLSTPVFDAPGRAQWELQIGPFRAAVPRMERERYVRELTSTAERLNELWR